MFKKLFKSQALWFIAAAAVLIAFIIFMQSYKSEQYIIGDLVEISSATARMDNFDKRDGSYTAEGDKLYIMFEPDKCEFFDEDGNSCSALDIEVGSRVKMTSSTGLKTDKYGYTTVYINKVEVLPDEE